MDLSDPGLRQVALLMAPRAAALGLIYTKFVMRSNFASRLGEGSVSALDFAWDLMQLPETIFATALALAVFPTLAELWAKQEREALAQTFNQAIRAILALTVPAAVGLLILGTPIVRAFYERGEFGAGFEHGRVLRPDLLCLWHRRATACWKSWPASFTRRRTPCDRCTRRW